MSIKIRSADRPVGGQTTSQHPPFTSSACVVPPPNIHATSSHASRRRQSATSPLSASTMTLLRLLHLLSCLPHLSPVLVSAVESKPRLQIDSIKPVKCARPTRRGDAVTVHYFGTLQSTGAEFDESYSTDQPLRFTLGAGAVIAGWEHGLLDMCPGEIRTLTIPPEMAYGQRGSPPDIPENATLIFTTELVEMEGVGGGKSMVAEPGNEDDMPPPGGPPLGPPRGPPRGPPGGPPQGPPGGPPPHGPPPHGPPEGQCHLLGPFALLVQGALGAAAILSLVYKRWREENKRPWLIWFFDVSKQVLGSAMLHTLNLLMSTVGAMDLEHAVQTSVGRKMHGQPTEEVLDGRTTPNPCSYYLLNLAIDVRRSSSVSSPLLTRRLDHHWHSRALPPAALATHRRSLHPTCSTSGVAALGMVRRAAADVVVDEAAAALRSRADGHENVRVGAVCLVALAAVGR